jgi:hypothetical protein
VTPAQKAMQEATGRSLTDAARLDAQHIDEGARLVRAGLAAHGWPKAHPLLAADLGQLLYRQGLAMARLARDHAARELGTLSHDAQAAAQRTTITAPLPGPLRSLAEGLFARVAEAVGERTDPALVLAEQPQVDRLVQTEGWRSYGAQRRAVELSLLGMHSAEFSSRSGSMVRFSDAPVIAVVWDATLDRRVCEACKGVEGAIRPLGATFDGQAEPPLHPRCRCVAAYWPVAVSL